MADTLGPNAHLNLLPQLSCLLQHVTRNCALTKNIARVSKTEAVRIDKRLYQNSIL